MRRLIVALSLCLAFVSVSPEAMAAFGRDQPVYNVTEAAFAPVSGKQPSLDEVRTAITRAATARKWVVRNEGPGHLVATIHVRQHMASVDIKFTPKTYTITYRDSQVLRYNGTTIHRNYNKWIKLLEQDIQSALNAL